MKKKVLIIGSAGQMGRIVDEKFNIVKYDIHVADPAYEPSEQYHDIHDINKISYKDFDLIVGCVPSQFGFKYMQEATEAGVNYVDMSFMPEDPFQKLENVKSKIITDAGLAPGLTNFITGYWVGKHGEVDGIDLNVGGVATDPTQPYGYAKTWCVEDLFEEFHRPAKHLAYGAILEDLPYAQHPKSEMYYIKHFEMERFLTDGLRSLVYLKNKVYTLKEYTLRWPGHLYSIGPYLDNKQAFVKEINEKCSDILDTVIFHAEGDIVDPDGDNDIMEKATMICRGELKESAMAQTTAVTCLTVCEMMLDGCFDRWDTGIYGMEHMGMDKKIAAEFLERLKDTNIVFDFETLNMSTMKAKR